MMKDASVILDLDGTMIDTASDLIAATNYTLCQFGKPAVPERVIEPAVGLGAKAMLHAALLSLGHEPSAEELKTMMPHFIDYYGDHLAERSMPFPGLEDALAGLRAEGALLGVCTNKLSALARKLLAELRLEHYFAFIAGADSFPVRKPDPGHLLGTIEAIGGDARRAAMIGDSSADSKAARAAKVPFIAVTFGYGEKPVELLRPDAIIGHFSELGAALRSLASLQGHAA
jgi:phosphoglycolate phosphatase